MLSRLLLLLIQHMSSSVLKSSAEGKLRSIGVCPNQGGRLVQIVGMDRRGLKAWLRLLQFGASDLLCLPA